MEYPVKIVSRAKDLWLTRPEGMNKWRSFADVAKTVNAEFGTTIPRKTIHEWSVQFGWLRQEEPAPVKTPVALAPTIPDNTPDVNWDWEQEKARFLAELAGIAHDCLAAVRNNEGKPVLIFKDAESATKTGLAAIDAIGKINSGKYDAPESGDGVARIREEQMPDIINFFIYNQAERPALDKQVIQGEFVVIDSDGQTSRGNEDRSGTPLIDAGNPQRG